MAYMSQCEEGFSFPESLPWSSNTEKLRLTSFMSHVAFGLAQPNGTQSDEEQT